MVSNEGPRRRGRHDPIRNGRPTGGRMSLIRQVWLLLSVTLALAFAGAIGVYVHSARHYLQTQLNLKNNDTAQSLALTLSQQHGDPVALELAIASQFDTGFYERIRLLAPGGRT